MGGGLAEFESQELMAGVQEGSDASAGAIFDRFAARLRRLAGRRMSGKLRRRVDSEDIVQSAFRDFFVQAASKRLVLRRAGDLWRLLASITLHKLKSQVERHSAARRNVDAEAAVQFSAFFESASIDANPLSSVAMKELYQRRLEQLDPMERKAFLSHLGGDSIQEISQSLERSERTVRRLLLQSQRHFEKAFLDPHPFAADECTEGDRIKGGGRPVRLDYSDFVLEKLIGSGGMGKVYRASQRSTGQRVAVKALRKTHQAEPRAVRRFVQEVEIVGRLRHPNIIGVHGLGQFPGGGYFLVMDLVEGCDLESRLASGPLDIREAVRIVRFVGKAIQHAHDRGVIHCDLKPANVMLDENGKPYVGDFGFAQLLRSGPSERSVGGTIGYIAPEVLAGGVGAITAGVDVYGLGAILYASVTGAPPGPDIERPRNRDVPTWLRTVWRKCLSIRPSERYSSVKELLAALAE